MRAFLFSLTALAIADAFILKGLPASVGGWVLIVISLWLACLLVGLAFLSRIRPSDERGSRRFPRR
jgi:hypothetical protein